MKRPCFEQNLSWTPVAAGETLLGVTIGQVALVKLNRPDARNALSLELFTTLCDHLSALDDDRDVASIVLTGGSKVFAAGADVREFAGRSALEMHALPRLEEWLRIRRIRKPVIAAVNGAALGGGCELALACDIIVAGESAFFGQPEINLGLIPGGGGTQRLIRTVGKSAAMEMILTGRQLPASDAFRLGLVSRLVPDELVLDTAIGIGEAIAARPAESVAKAKEAILLAETESLLDGLEHERRLFESIFDSANTQEGMQAFLDKRKPGFS